jgi:hypothetical protein
MFVAFRSRSVELLSTQTAKNGILPLGHQLELKVIYNAAGGGTWHGRWTYSQNFVLVEPIRFTEYGGNCNSM